MTNKARDWPALTREIGPELAVHTGYHDTQGTFVEESYAVLKKHRFFSLAIPTTLGGGGASYPELCDTIRTIAHYCGSTALAFSMHSHLVAATVWKHLHGKPDEKLLRKVADSQTVLLSTGASDWIDSNGSMKQVDGGYLVSGRKIFGSGGPAADLLIASARYEDPNGETHVLHFPIPAQAEGVTFLEDWNTLGMRGTGSNTIVLKDVFVPQEAIALKRPPGQWHPAWSIVITVAPPIYMAAYTGIAESAAKIALDGARKKIGDPHLPYLAGELSNLVASTQMAWQGMVQNVNNYDFVPQLDRANKALIGKTLCTTAAIETVEKAMEVAGGKGYFRGFSMERLLRDIHAAPYHPLSEKRQIHFTGRIALGLDPITGNPTE